MSAIGKKSDHLAAARHGERWRERLDVSQARLAAIASEVRWGTSAARALGVARAIDLSLRDGARVWSVADGLVPARPAEFRARLAR